MRQVEVPPDLRDQLLARLEAERGDWYRQRFAHRARAGRRRRRGAAARLGRLVLGERRTPSRRSIRSQVADAATTDATEDPRTRTEEALKRLGVDTPLSPHLDYHFLVCPPAMAELPGYPGRKVPMLVFAGSGRVAIVYLIREKAIPDDTPEKIGGSTFKAELLHGPRANRIASSSSTTALTSTGSARPHPPRRNPRASRKGARKCQRKNKVKRETILCLSFLVHSFRFACRSVLASHASDVGFRVSMCSMIAAATSTPVVF